MRAPQRGTGFRGRSSPCPDDHDRSRPAVADALASGRARSDDASPRRARWPSPSRPAAARRYLDAWIAIVVPPLAAEPDHRPAVLAARIENILRSWRMLAEAPRFGGLAPDVAALIEGGIGRHAGALAARVPSAGAGHAEATHALLVAGLAFDGAEGLAERAIAELDRGLAAGGLAGRRPPRRHARRAPARAAPLARGRRERPALRAAPAGRLRRPRRRGLRLRHAHRGRRPRDRAPDRAATTCSSPPTSPAATTCAGRAPRAATDGRPPRATPSFRYVGVHVQRTGWGAGATPFADERRLLLDESTLGASISTRLGEILIAPDSTDDGVLVTRTGRWRIDVVVAANERRRRQIAMLPGGAWLVVDHGGLRRTPHAACRPAPRWRPPSAAARG